MAKAHTSQSAVFGSTEIGTMTNLATLATHADWTVRQETGEQRKSSAGPPYKIYIDSSGRSVYEYTAYTPASEDYSVESRYNDRFADTGDYYHGVVVRLADLGSGSWEGYVLWFFDDYSTPSGGNFAITRYDSDSSSSTIATSSTGQTMVDTDTMTLEVSGTGATVTLKAYKNATEVISTTDTHADRIVTTGKGGSFAYITNSNAPYWNQWRLLEAAGGSDVTWYYRAQQEAVA